MSEAPRPERAPVARSLRWKLTLWFLGVFTAIQLVLLGGVVLLRADAIREAVEAEFAASAAAMVESLLASELDLTQDDLGIVVPRGAGFVAAAVRGARGEVLARWNLPEGEELPIDAWEFVPSGPLGPIFRELEPELARRVTGDPHAQQVTLPFRAEDVPMYLQAVVRSRRAGARLGPILDLLLVGVPAGTIAALVAAWLIAGRAVRPIRRLSVAARDVGPSTLGERFSAQNDDHEFRALEGELNAALERLEVGYRAQEEFISNVSHELKTPIAVLLTEAQVVQSAEDPRQRDAFVAAAERELRELGRVVESFLQIARAEIRRDLPLAPVPLEDLVLESIESCERLAAAHEVPLVPALPDAGDGPRVLGDAVLLRTMLDNLVRNAIRHSPRGAPVRVELLAGADLARLVVRDLGPGIPAGQEDAIFERFVRLPREADGSGSGVGLSIAAHIAGLHGGRVRVANGEEGGGVFTIELPVVD